MAHKKEVHKEESSKKEKKSNKLLISVGAAAIIVLLVFGFLGFVPGLSHLLGTNKPRDLGVRATEADFISASEKLGRTRGTMDSSSPENSLKFEGSHRVDASFTQEEVTATMQSRDYKYNPLSKDFQAKFHEDGTVEMSGAFVVDNFRPYGKAAKVSDRQIEEITSKAGILKANPAFYVKGKGTVVNNRLSYDVEKIEVGRVSIPTGIVPEGYVSRFVEDRINSISGLYVEKLELEEGKLNFKGSYPDKSYYYTG